MGGGVQENQNNHNNYFVSGFVPGTYLNVVHPQDSRIKFYIEKEKQEKAEYKKRVAEGEDGNNVDCDCADKTYMQVWFPWWFVEKKLKGKDEEELERELDAADGSLLTINSNDDVLTLDESPAGVINERSHETMGTLSRRDFDRRRSRMRQLMNEDEHGSLTSQTGHNMSQPRPLLAGDSNLTLPHVGSNSTFFGSLTSKPSPLGRFQ